ncbi:MAG: glycosyltransferase [Gemmatimonadaceae bacterium]|nr:glycosyltransferase [Gemmatimonadaceae bacterium]
MTPPRPAPAARPTLYLTIFAAWFASLAWFHPRLLALLPLAESRLATGALLFFIVFTEIAWLYGFYNVFVVLFAMWYRRRQRVSPPAPDAPIEGELPRVAMLYLTCNDFVEASAASCLAQDYAAYRVYILDDSSDADCRAQVDAFAARDPERIQVVRRSDRRGFKAGNLNHGLASAAVMEPLFAIVDADEILPADFLTRMVPRLLGDPSCGYVQANHRCNHRDAGTIAGAVGVGIDIHWRWYHPLRNRWGFVMLLGHGALIRRQVWEEIGGFPEIVSEDLGFSVRARERGWGGVFADDIVCLEDFPETMRAFRVRHIKWTRGTCEFFAREMWPVLRAKRMPWVEKLDVLFPALSLPLALFYFLFVIDANLLFTMLFSHPRPLTAVLAGHELVLPMRALDARFAVVSSWDFFLVTVLTFVAPVLCFIVELARTPRELFSFLCRSSVIYSALGPLSSLGVVGYLLSGTATFLVTGDRGTANTGSPTRRSPAPWRRAVALVRSAVQTSHPDHPLVQGFEILCGIVFALACLQMGQLSFLGLALGFVMAPVLHHTPWNHPVIQRLVYVPFTLIMGGLAVGGMGLLGVQTVFFGYGFHF